MGVASQETIQGAEHGTGIGTVGLEPPVVVVPVARTNDMVSHSHFGQSAVQPKAKWARFVAGHNGKTLIQFFLHPRQQTRPIKTLRRFWRRTIDLHGDNIRPGMRINADL